MIGGFRNPKTLKNFHASVSFAALVGVISSGAGKVPAIGAETATRSVSVQFGDLNVGTAEGAKVLLERITTAAGRACAPVDRSHAEALYGLHDCIHTAFGSTVRKVNSRELAAAFEKKYGERAPVRLAALED